MVRKCDYCGKEFNIKKKEQRFCSHECHIKYHDKNRPPRRYKVICDNCGKEFTSSCNKNKSHPLVFCSKKCSNEYRKNNTISICKICGKEFHPINSRQICCSRNCTEKLKRFTDGKICKNCGREFHSQTRTDFCCKECKKEYKNKQRIEMECEFCGKKFMGIPGQSKFCNSNCKQRALHQRRIEEVVCENCGKTYTRSKPFKENGHAFCSHSCCIEWEYKTGIVYARYTKPHKNINILLDEMNIMYQNEFQCSKYSLDIYLPNDNKAIEVMGNYWHGNSVKYKKEDLNEKQIACIEKDKRKNIFIKEVYGIEILYLWEQDIKNKELCKILIEKFLKNKLDYKHSSGYNFINNELKRNNVKQFMEI